MGSALTSGKMENQVGITPFAYCYTEIYLKSVYAHLKFILRLYQVLEKWEVNATAQLLKAPSMNVDETSLRVDKKAISGFPNQWNTINMLFHRGNVPSYSVRKLLGICAGISRSPTVR